MGWRRLEKIFTIRLHNFGQDVKTAQSINFTIVSSKMCALALFIAGSVPLCCTGAETPPTVTVRPIITGTVPSANPWAMTISPAPVGGTNNQIVTTSPYSVYYPGYGPGWNASGYVTLRPGERYTFKLSTWFGGSWATNQSPGVYSGICGAYFYNYGDPLAGTYPNWVWETSIYPANQPGSYPIQVGPSNLNDVHWTYTVSPRLVSMVEDSSWNPQITTYLPLDGKMNTDGTITLAKDFVIWTVPGARIDSLVSSRNTGGSPVDSFSPAAGNADSTGAFRTKLLTKNTTGQVAITANVRARGNLAFGLPTGYTNILPAKCRNKFDCSCYYTPLQSGCHGPLKSVEGLPYRFEKDFIRATKQEGYGRLRAPLQGHNYIRWDSNLKIFTFADSVQGNANNNRSYALKA